MHPTKLTPGSFATRGLLVAAVAFLGGAAAFGGLFDRATAQAPAEKAASAKEIEAFSKQQKAGIETIIREYLLANPEILFEVQNVLEKRAEEMQAERMKTAIKSNAEELYRRTDAPMAGDPDGDVTVVEFFDYNCGFCKRGLSQLSKLIDNDKKVRVVLKELPILSQGSEEASRIALAAKKQGKYWEVHSALLNHRGSLDGNSAMRVAGKLGLDVEKLNKDKDSKEVTAEIEKVREIAQKMGINGTPHFLVGDRTIPGAPENLYEQLAGHVKDLRENGCEVC